MVNTYIPVLRNGRNETPAIKNFNQSSLSGSSSRALDMVPLVEITDEDDIEELAPFERAGEFLMIELPQYLTDRANRYNDAVTGLIEEFGGVVDFYLDHSDKIEVPVVSGPLDPVDYSYYRTAYEDLSDEFDRIALRLLMVDFGYELTNDQKKSLEGLADVVSDDDVLLFDLVDTEPTDGLKKDLRFLADLFSGNLRAVLNAFDAYDDQPDNQSPHLSDEIGATAFGDFGINQRFKLDREGGPATVKHRHYYPGESTVEFFQGEDYEAAAEALRSWSEWDRSHCDGCRKADRTSKYDPNTWSQIKMTHYFSSVLNGEI